MIFRLALNKKVRIRVKSVNELLKIQISYECGPKVVESFLNGDEKELSGTMKVNSGLDYEISKEMVKAISKKDLRIKFNEPNLFKFIYYFPIVYSNIGKYSEDIPDEGAKLYIWPQIKLHSEVSTKIIVVDDMPINLDIAKKVISLINIECKCVLSGEEAIKKLMKKNSSKSKYKVIIMDCMMPDMDGWETSSTILSLYKEKKLSYFPYIIGHSAFQSKDDIERCFTSGMDDFLPKPSAPKEYYNKISKWLSEPLRQIEL